MDWLFDPYGNMLINSLCYISIRFRWHRFQRLHCKKISSYLSTYKFYWCNILGIWETFDKIWYRWYSKRRYHGIGSKCIRCKWSRPPAKYWDWNYQKLMSFILTVFYIKNWVLIQIYFISFNRISPWHCSGLHQHPKFFPFSCFIL